jgi:hypothetical protein
LDEANHAQALLVKIRKSGFELDFCDNNNNNKLHLNFKPSNPNNFLNA